MRGLPLRTAVRARWSATEGFRTPSVATVLEAAARLAAGPQHLGCSSCKRCSAVSRNGAVSANKDVVASARPTPQLKRRESAAPTAVPTTPMPTVRGGSVRSSPRSAPGAHADR